MEIFRELLTPILVTTTIILFAIWNGFVIQWKLTGQSIWSDRWHAMSLVIKLCLISIAYINGGWIWALVTLFTCWFPYNIIIALIMKQKWYYVGKTSWFDKQIRKLFFFINFDK